MKNLKKLNLLGIFFVMFSFSIYAQNNSVGIGTLTPDNSAILELESTNQGFLMTRLDSSQILTLPLPAEGLIIYNTDDKCFWYNNSLSWWRICNTDSLLTLINNYGDTIGYIYDSLAVHNTNIYNNTTLINNYGDTINYIYDSLSVHNTNIYNNIVNIQNLSDSLGWVYDSLAVHNTNIYNLFDSISVINNHLTAIDSTLLEKWDLWGNGGTNPTVNFLGTTDNVDLVFRTNNTEKVRILSSGNIGVGTNAPSELLDINSNAIRLRNGATNNFILTTNATGVGTWQNPSTNPLISQFGNDWKLLGNSGTNPSTNFLGTTDNIDLVIRTNNTEKIRIQNDGDVGIGLSPLANLHVNGGMFYVQGNTANTHELAAKNGTGITQFYWGGVNRNFVAGRSNNLINVAPVDNYILGSTNTGLGTGPNWIIGHDNNLLLSGGPMQSRENFIFGANNTINQNDGVISNFVIGNNNTTFSTNIFGSNNNCFSATNTFIVGSGVTTTQVGGLVLAPGGATGDPLLFDFNTAGRIAAVAPRGMRVYSVFNTAAGIGVRLNPGSGTWASISDKNSKTNITNLNYKQILNAYSNFDITKWSYKTQTKENESYNKDIFHIGIMAQDFYSSFGLGVEENTITALDVSGVNMAAIKGLIEENKMLKERLNLLEEKLKNIK